MPSLKNFQDQRACFIIYFKIATTLLLQGTQTKIRKRTINLSWFLSCVASKFFSNNNCGRKEWKLLGERVRALGGEKEI